MRTSPPAVLFDLDGTLIDSIELILSSARHAFAGRPNVPSDEEWVAGIGTPLLTQLRQYAADDADLAALVASYRAFQNEHHDRLTRCYDDVPATVEELHRRGHPLGIVTSKANFLAARSLEFVGLDRYIPVVVGYDDTSRHKPEPEPVLLALDRLGVTADNAFYVGDSPHDVRAGNAAGVSTVAVLSGPFNRETLAAAEPNYIIECMAELTEVLDRLAAPGR